MVHIRKVEIFGFKSFGFKNTTIDFEPGLVSISGPNGSGKSNILDAIIFALGENRPKVMRADKLKSLIHDVESDRRGPKFARASVHFDNSDRKIPVDSDSVEITREMDSKGENVYYLNKKKTLRTRILDLLDIANAGLSQLNNVQQGTVTRISEFSPDEKREIIETLIGLKYFDEKKLEAEKQLQAADQRLEIAMAKMGEVKNQIDILEEERNYKLRHDFIEREIIRLNAIDAANKMKGINSEKLSKERSLNSLISETKKFAEELSIIKSETNKIESEKSEFMQDTNAHNQAKASIESQLSAAMQKHEGVNSVIITNKKRLQQIETRLPEIKKEIQKILQEKNHNDSHSFQLQESFDKIDLEKKKIDDELKLLDSELTKVVSQQSQAASNRHNIDVKIKNLLDKLNHEKLTFAQFKSEKDDLGKKINANKNKNDQVNIEINNLERLTQKLDTLIVNHKATIVELKSRISKFNTKRLKYENDIEETNQILEKSSKAANQYETKIRIVKNTMHEDYSIAKLKENAEQLGILGLVYEIISWDKQYDRAILAACSDWIKAIVVKDFSTLVSLAEFARFKKLPKLKIIPIDAIPYLKLTPPKEKGVIGILADHVKCDSKFIPIKKFLFGNIVLTNSNESAHKVSKAGYKSVSIHGEFFDAKSSAVVIDINSKISKITKIISQSSSVDSLIQLNNHLKKSVQQKKNSLKQINDIIRGYESRLSISETGLATTDQNSNDSRNRISRAKNLTNALLSKIEHDSRKRERFQTEIAKQSSYISSLEQRISIVKENYQEGEDIRITNQFARLNEEKVNLQKRQTEVASEYNEVRVLYDENSRLNDEQQEIILAMENLEKQKETAEKQLVELRDKEQEIIASSGTSVSKLQEFDGQLKEFNEKEKTLTRENSTLERQSDTIKRDLKDLYEKEKNIQKIINTYDFGEDIDAFDITKVLQPLLAEQRTLTELNAKAPSTYLFISDGYRSSSDRKNSLEKERISIVNFIDNVEKEKRQKFLNAFDVVDKEIRIIFTKMTGGNAWLELQNEDDIFSSGISYLIQFPNKPKRESTSISGGEKTLAAVVFVLALQKLQPSPFYLFDEVDAHLDAPNAERLGKILKERSKESQFLMVSLKDSVVQRANLIYGVFPKNGVSHVVIYKDKRIPSITT